QALLALAGAGAETGIALDLLEVVEPGGDRVLDVGERDVLAAADDHFAGHRRWPSPSLTSLCLCLSVGGPAACACRGAGPGSRGGRASRASAAAARSWRCRWARRPSRR